MRWKSFAENSCKKTKKGSTNIFSPFIVKYIKNIADTHREMIDHGTSAVTIGRMFALCACDAA